MKNPMLIALAVLALVVMPANTQAQKIHTEIAADTTTGNRVATHVAAGGGWSTLVVLTNLGTTVESRRARREKSSSRGHLIFGVLVIHRGRFYSRVKDT